jgi:hypothetical protein
MHAAASPRPCSSSADSAEYLPGGPIGTTSPSDTSMLRGNSDARRSSSAVSARAAAGSPQPPRNASVRWTSSRWKRRNAPGTSGSSSTKAPLIGNAKNQFSRGMKAMDS